MQTVLEKPKKVQVPPEAQPFYYPGGEKAVFFIHGFSDSLCRVNGFAEFLASQGITTKGALLPGHCKTAEDLAKTTPDDWYQEVEHGIIALSKEKKEVYAVGISFGGNLALKFDAEHPGVLSGIVCIESPTKIRNQYLTRVAIPFAQAFGMKYWDKKYLKRLKHPEKEAVFKQGVLEKMPLINIQQVIDFLENRQKFLNKVKCDVLIIQSQQRGYVSRTSAQKIYDSVGSKRKEIYWIKNIYHAFLSEASKRKVFYKACEFFNIEL